MKVKNKLKPPTGPRIPDTVTIPNEASVSATYDLGDFCLVGFIMPSAWDTAQLNIEVSHNSVNWANTYDKDSALVGNLATPVANIPYSVDMLALLPWRYIRFRSGTSAAPVNQGAERTFTIIKRELA